MSKRVAILSSVAVGATTLLLWAQERPVFRVKVDMVVLSFTVQDSKGGYRNGLKPSDFRVLEDGIVQKLATFAEGNRPALQVNDDGTTRPLIAGEGGSPGKPGLDPRADAFIGTSVFVLFDTSNFMYRGFVYAEDAIADFIRGLDRADSVAGDDTALYNGLLLTLRDAAKVPGRKVVIVFPTDPITPAWWRPTMSGPSPKMKGFRST